MLKQWANVNLSNWDRKVRLERPGCDGGGLACNFLQLPVSVLQVHGWLSASVSGSGPGSELGSGSAHVLRMN